MNFESINVLVLDGSSRQTLPILKDLHKLKCKITTISSSRLDVGYSSRYPHKKLLSKMNLYDANGDNIIDNEIKSGKYDVVIPLSDLTTQYLSKNLEEYSKYVKTFIPEYDVFMKAYDKQQTMEICQEIGVPCTITKKTSESYEDFIRRTGYPIAVKPRSGCGSIGFRCIRNEKEWETFKAEVDNPDNYVVQEYVEQTGSQYNIHYFIDQLGNVSFVVPAEKCRWFPVDGGASCFCRVMDLPKAVDDGIKLLKEIGWKGYCEIEFVEDLKTNKIKVMEINGRTSASIKICELLGVNVAESMIELAYNERVTDQTKKPQDVRLRCIHTDLLWFLKSPKRFKAEPSWFSICNTHDQIFDISDPIPFFTFSIQALMIYRKEMERRAR